MFTRCLIILSIFSCPFLAKGQVPAFSFRNIGINEGLSQSSVVDIAVDATGFVWFATQEGLNRYDGKKFRVFKRNFDDVTTSSANRLGKIVPGNKNDLWLITTGGKLERLDLYDHSFHRFEKISPDSVQLPAVTCLLIEGTKVWIGTENEGVILFDWVSNQIRRYIANAGSTTGLSDSHVYSIFRDADNHHWVLTGNGLSVIDPPGNTIRKMLWDRNDNGTSFGTIDADRENTLWIGSFGSGLFYKKPTDTLPQKFTGFTNLETIPHDLVIESVKCDRSGRIWVGTYGKGLYVINNKDKTIEHILANKRTPFSLGYNDVLCIIQDSVGGIWIGTDGGGVSYWHNALNNFITYSNLNLPSHISIEQVRSIVTGNDGVIWAGTSNQGLVFIDPINSKFEQLHFPPFRKGSAIPERIVSLHCDDEGDIWAGTQGNGLIILDPRTKKIKQWFHPDETGILSFPDQTIWCMFPASEGEVWAGTQNAGLCLINKKRGVLKKITSVGGPFADNSVRAITPLNDQTFCIGYERKGIQLFNSSTGKITPLNNTVLNQVWTSQATLKCTFFRPPYLLVGTLGQGLIVHNLSSGKTDIITEANGLPNNTVYGILEDKLGHLWLSTNNGLCCVTLSENISTTNSSHFTVYDVEDGLQSNEFNTGAYYTAANGTLFFGGIKGLTFFNPATFTTVSQDVPVVITQATINNEPFTGDTSISHKKLLKLHYRENSVSFDFAALDYLAGSGINYFYRLNGYDKDWISAGNRNYAAYTNISPGNYVFEVRASNQRNIEHSPITQLFIKISPPFWQTWWFVTLCLVIAAATVYALDRYRIKQLLKLQRVRTRIATDLHDDIGSTLTNINILSELSLKNIDNKPEAEKFLHRISEEINASGQALDDIVWSINKNNDSIEQTVARMRRYAAEVFESTYTSYTLKSDEQIAHRKLNMELRRDYFLLFKEAVNNVHKHAKAKNVHMEVGVEKNRILLHIQDDGVGFNPKASTHRNGIKNMYTRSEKWKGSVQITSAVGKGTKLIISLQIL
jgi:ligand-binding sensor domain-containing protein/signal transduction histidine kinase